MPPITRLGDLSTADPCGAPPRASASASTNVFINNVAAHRKGDSWQLHACPKSAPHGAVTVGGSGSVFVNGKAVARLGDSISCGSTVAGHSPNVFAG